MATPQPADGGGGVDVASLQAMLAGMQAQMNAMSARVQAEPPPEGRPRAFTVPAAPPLAQM